MSAAGWPVLWSGVVAPHEVFHVLVLRGAALHYEFVYRHCVGQLDERAPLQPAGLRAVWPDGAGGNRIEQPRDLAGTIEMGTPRSRMKDTGPP